ncbi:efflux RND transporter periplasmic adaptor subunit [Martelella soudanensis]|uniref:hypothetical protein n=1 Tax=unclassified Martelella TaxID=2629616 RepID=UPI0015DDB441|nr:MULTISPECIES: hypothetical protein [unclassified Martelella]
MSLVRTSIMAFGVVMGVGAAAWAVQGGVWPREQVADQAPNRTELRIADRPFTERVVRQCHIEYGAPRALSAPADGLLELLVADGAAVKKGDIIARYAIDKLESEERRLAADIESLRSRIAFKSGPYRTESEAIWQIERETQESSRARLRAKLKEMERLEASGQIAPQRLEETRLRLEEADAEHARLSHQRTLDRAQIALDIGQMEHDLSVGEARLEDIGREKDRSALAAPENGVVIWRDPHLAEAGGGELRRGTPIASLVTPGRYGAVVRFGDSDMRVVEDASVSVGFEDGREPVRAEIVSKRLVDDPIEQKRGRYAYDVAIVFEGDETMLHSQALCNFSRPVATPSAAIPASALRFQSGRAYAMKLEDGKTGLVELELGEVADGYVRVLAGLKSGDIVVE